MVCHVVLLMSDSAPRCMPDGDVVVDSFHVLIFDLNASRVIRGESSLGVKCCCKDFINKEVISGRSESL